jgi:hypothetical protein
MRPTDWGKKRVFPAHVTMAYQLLNTLCEQLRKRLQNDYETAVLSNSLDRTDTNKITKDRRFQ